MKPTKKAIISLFIAVPCIWALAWFFLTWIDTPEQRGQFGDMFGAVNALFSGWAFVGVIIAILLQKEELELQRKELEETRKEFQQQNETLKRQRFENTFFNMLSLHNQIISEAKLYNPAYGSHLVSRQVFAEVLTSCRRLYDSIQTKASFGKTQQAITDVFLRQYADILGHYFRNLYRIFVFLESSDIGDKFFYAKIIRAQLSDSELILLYYNCYFYKKGQGFQVYAEKYKLFDNLPVNELIDKINDIDFLSDE